MRKYLIIAGHGAGDPGAVGNGKKEADLTREFGKLLNKYLDGSTLYNTSRNVYADRNIASISKNYDEVIELHFNAASASAHGTEVLINGKADNVDYKIIGTLNDYFTDRGFKSASQLYNANNSAKPYRLVEIGFITNKNDMNIYQKNKDAIAQKMAKALGQYKGGSTPSKSKITYDVWNLKNQYGANIYFYAQSYENGKVKRNQLDNDKNRDVWYFPEGYKSIKAVDKAYIYHDKNLTKKWINSSGNHSYIPKGKYVLAKFVGKVTK